MVLAKLGVNQLPQPNSAGWIHISCLFAPFKHKSGTDRSGGMAIKVEDAGTSAYDCKACKMHGRISGLARALGHFRGRDYDEIAADADRYDMLGTELPDFDAHFTVEESLPEPLNEQNFAGLFESIDNHPEAQAFMIKRRIGKLTCDTLRIEFDPDKRRIVFPVRNGEGHLFGWSGRTVIPDYEPKVLDYAGLPKRHLILGEERWRPGYRKLIVEGLIAYARMHEIGAEAHVDIGALLGSTLTPEKAAILMAHNCAVLAMPDPDKAGAQCLYGQWRDFSDLEMEERSRRGLPPETGEFKGGGLIDMLAGDIPVMVPYYPAGVTDIDDIELPDLLRVIESAPMVFPAPVGLDKKSRGR
jgi:hypothetical protein